MVNRDAPNSGTPGSAGSDGRGRLEPFADDAAVEIVGGLSIENGTDRIAIHGTVDLPRDREGLARARALAATLSAIVAALETQTLPERVADAKRSGGPVKNPFA